MNQWTPIVVGVVALAGVLATLWQRQKSEQEDRAHRLQHDARTEWWRRYQWAAEQISQHDNRTAQTNGYAVISALSDDESLITGSERAILRELAKPHKPRDTRNQPKGGRQ